MSQPDSGEQGLEIAGKLIDSGAVDLVVVDSVAALVPRAEIDGDIGDSHVGLQARMMSQAMRKLSASINKTKTIAIFINQLREKVGVMFGNPETTPGGRALKFYASVRLDVRGTTQIKGTGDQKDSSIGKETKIKVVKNKVAPPFKVAEVEIMYGEGISRTGELVKIASDLDIIQKQVLGSLIMVRRLAKVLKMLSVIWPIIHNCLMKSTVKYVLNLVCLKKAKKNLLWQ